MARRPPSARSWRSRSPGRACARRSWRAPTTTGSATRSSTSWKSALMPEVPPAGAWRQSLCPYCGVGCGLLVRVDEGRVVKVKGDPEHPANFGDICAKAVHLPPVLGTGRLLYPEIRSRRDADRQQVPWELALRFTADRVREIVAAHGPNAIAFYGSGQLLTEEYYVASK